MQTPHQLGVNQCGLFWRMGKSGQDPTELSLGLLANIFRLSMFKNNLDITLCFNYHG